MAKSSVPRHSKPARKPVTIELEPSSVTKTSPKQENVPEPEPVGFEPGDGSSNMRNTVRTKRNRFFPTRRTKHSRSGGRNLWRFQTLLRQRRYVEPKGKRSFWAPGIRIRWWCRRRWSVRLVCNGRACCHHPRQDISALEQQIAELRNVPASGQTLDEGAQVALNGAVENAKQAAGQVSAFPLSSTRSSKVLRRRRRMLALAHAADTSGDRCAHCRFGNAAEQQSAASRAGWRGRSRRYGTA